MYRFPDPLDEDSLKTLVADPRYGDPLHPEYPHYRQFVDKAFSLVYPDPPRNGAGDFVVDPRDPPKPQVITGGAEFRPGESGPDGDVPLGPEGTTGGEESPSPFLLSQPPTRSHPISRGEDMLRPHETWLPSEPEYGEGDNEWLDHNDSLRREVDGGIPARKELSTNAYTSVRLSNPKSSSATEGEIRRGYKDAIAKPEWMPRMVPPLRGPLLTRNDRQGRGDRDAPRTNADGTLRPHYGHDFVARPGDDVLSPVSGTITRVDVRPYAKSKTIAGVQIVSDDGYVIQIHYTEPLANLKPGDRVSAGDLIAHVQDVSAYHRQQGHSGMTNHIHVEVWQRDDGQPAQAKAYNTKKDLEPNFTARNPMSAFRP